MLYRLVNALDVLLALMADLISGASEQEPAGMPTRWQTARGAMARGVGYDFLRDRQRHYLPILAAHHERGLR